MVNGSSGDNIVFVFKFITQTNNLPIFLIKLLFSFLINLVYHFRCFLYIVNINCIVIK
ncbi:hypothetical protein ACFSPU_13230 [Haoranjiania flava]|uniref:hypothetical protein n=1 Tax=Haoranjiania flava TaxID=1856322 RepID=UPI00363CE53F